MSSLPAGARGRNRAVWVVAVLATVVATEIGLSFRSPPPTPDQLLRQALTAAGSADACHYRAVWQAGGVSQIVVGDARPESGSESVSVAGDRYTVVFTGHEAYFSGDAASLRDQLALPMATAAANAGKWISIQQSDGPYPSVGEGLTTSAALAEVLIAPFAASPDRGAHGATASRITGRIPHGSFDTGSASLELMARTELPARYSARGYNGDEPWSNTIAFSRWGDGRPITSPATAIPLASLETGAGGGETSTR